MLFLCYSCCHFPTVLFGFSLVFVLLVYFLQSTFYLSCALMIRFLYAIYDSVACELFGPVQMLPNDDVARRVFMDAVSGAGSSLASHPEDFSVFLLGSIDTASGVISPESDSPFRGVPILRGLDVARMMESRARVSAAESGSPRAVPGSDDPRQLSASL